MSSNLNYDNPVYEALPNITKPNQKWTWINGSSLAEIGYQTHTYSVYIGKSVFATQRQSSCSGDVIWIENDDNIFVCPDTVRNIWPVPELQEFTKIIDFP